MQEHSLAKFVDLPLDGAYADHISMCNYGEHGTGKTRLIVTAPSKDSSGAVGVVPLDSKTRATIRDARRELSLEHKRFKFPAEDFIRHQQPMALAMMKPEEAIKYYRKHVNKIKDACWTLAEDKQVSTIAIDSGSQLWEDVLYAHYGRSQRILPRDRGPANQEMRDLLNSLQDKHLIVTHRSKEVWRNDKPTGLREPSGYSDMGYYVNVLAEHEHNQKPDRARNWRFSLSVRMCQARAALQGPDGENLLTDDSITFAALAMNIFPDSSPEDWE